MRALAMTGMETAEMIPSIMSGSLIRETPPWARMSAGTRSRAMTATAPASSAIRACSGVTTSMMTPPLRWSARPRRTRAVAACGSWGADVVGSWDTVTSGWWRGRDLTSLGERESPPGACSRLELADDGVPDEVAELSGGPGATEPLEGVAVHPQLAHVDPVLGDGVGGDGEVQAAGGVPRGEHRLPGQVDDPVALGGVDDEVTDDGDHGCTVPWALRLLRRTPSGSRSVLIRRSRSTAAAGRASASCSSRLRKVTGLRPDTGSPERSSRCFASIPRTVAGSLGTPKR